MTIHTISTYTLTLPGSMLRPGFWLYVWRVSTPTGVLLYVGRTGDSSSPHAASPYQRLGQHLGHQKTMNMLRQNIERRGMRPEDCSSFELIAHGPLFPPATDMDTHREPRDTVAALEKALAESLRAAGYDVLNTVNSRRLPDQRLWAEVRRAFSLHFARLGR